MQKNFWIIANETKQSQAIKNKLIEQIKKNKWILDEKSSNVIIIGGDGTFVNKFGKYCMDEHAKLILINTGFVGYYSSHLLANIKNISKVFEQDKFFVQPKLTQIEINGKKTNALNDIVIQANNTISLDLHVNNILYENFRGTGICFSTPTGSTGYNKSLHGAIILNNDEIWQIAEIAPMFHAKYRSFGNSLILSKDDEVIIKNIKSTSNSFLIIDGVKKDNDILQKDLDISVRLITSKAKIYFPNNQKEIIKNIRKVFIGENHA